MLRYIEHEIPGYEKVIEATCSKTRLHTFIAIHNTRLGPALGGTRFFDYGEPEEALKDVLRLSKAMSYKSAAIQDGLGGGKSVIIGDPKTIKSQALLQKFGEVLNYIGGKYIAAEDVGTSVDDMMTINQTSPYVAGLPTRLSCGDPSRFTAWGIFKGLQAVAKMLWHTNSLENKTIAIQGLGNVGMKLAELLFWEKANLIVADLDPEKSSKAAHEMGAVVLKPEEILSAECDILAPCAMGAVISLETIPYLNCLAVAGGANNQLSSNEAGVALYQRGILYAPDYLINAGGIINASSEFEKNGYDPKLARNKTDKIYDTLLTIFSKSKIEQKPTHLLADELAEFNLTHEIGKRLEPIQFTMV